MSNVRLTESVNLFFLFTSGMTQSPPTDSTKTVLILLFCLLGLIILLIFLYKKLNKEADGKYTVRNIMYREGGIRDQVRGAALAVGTSLGVQLWPGGETEEDGEEMQEIQDEEGQVEEGDRQGSDSEGDDQEEGDHSAKHCDESEGEGEDTSDDDSDSEGSKQEEQAKLMDQQEAKGETEEEKEEKVGEGEGKGEASGGAGLLIDLKQFSGSAIWSEEGGGEGKDGDVTAL